MDGFPQTDDLAAKTLAIAQELFSERAHYEGQWREIAEYIYPSRAIQLSPGQKLMSKIYDGTPRWAAQNLANSLHTLIANPSVRCFDFETENDEDMTSFAVRAWLQASARALHTIITNSNFHSSIHELFMDFLLFGNACIYVEDDPNSILSFHSRPMGEVSWDVNSRGFVDTVSREFQMSVRQMAQQFGAENLHEEFQKALTEPAKANTKYPVVHLVRPRGEWIKGSIQKKNFPFESVYVDKNHRRTLEIGGYLEFPFACPRWAVSTGEKYGRGPGEAALPDSKQIHVVQKHTLRAVQKATDPAIAIPDKMFLSPLMTSAGKINYYRATGVNGFPPNQAIVPIPSGGSFPVAREEKEDLRMSVSRAFFVDQLRIPNNDRMTAREVNQRVQENMGTLAPVLGRCNTELMAIIIARAYNIAERSGHMPPVPQEMDGKRVTVRFTSPLAKTQRMTEMQGLVSAMDIITPIANVDPSVLKVFNPERFARTALEAFGAPMDVMESPEDIQAQKAKDEQAQDMTNQLAQAQAMSGSVKDIASATKDYAGAQQLRGGNPLMQ